MNNHTKFASWKPSRLNLDLQKGIYMDTLFPQTRVMTWSPALTCSTQHWYTPHQLHRIRTILQKASRLGGGTLSFTWWSEFCMQKPRVTCKQPATGSNSVGEFADQSMWTESPALKNMTAASNWRVNVSALPPTTALVFIGHLGRNIADLATLTGAKFCNC